jgi:hypothetical protein
VLVYLNEIREVNQHVTRLFDSADDIEAGCDEIVCSSSADKVGRQRQGVEALCHVHETIGESESIDNLLDLATAWR